MNKLINIWILLALAFAITTTSCKDDDGLADGFVEFRHDAENVDAPILPLGAYESAARFINSYPGNDDGSELTEIQYYIKAVPATASMRVYAGGIDAPEEMIYEAEILGEINGESWNTHTPASPIVLDGRDLWISVVYTQSGEARVMGCDGGPADTNGDWIYDFSNNTWSALVDRTSNAVNINWNIRGIVKEAP